MVDMAVSSDYETQFFWGKTQGENIVYQTVKTLWLCHF